MSDLIYSIRLLMRELNLNNIAANEFHLHENSEMSQLEFLEYILSEEQRMRKLKKHERRLRQGNIPQLEYDITVDGINKEQLNRILTLGFTETYGNLIIVGQCRTGKTSLASSLGQRMILREKIVYYVKYYDLMDILYTRATSPAAKRKYDYIMTSDMIIIDEVLYTGITGEDLTALFRFVSSVNDIASIVIITNRYFDEWLDASEDEFLMQTLIERLLGDCEIFKTQTLQSDLLPTRTPRKKSVKKSSKK